MNRLIIAFAFLLLGISSEAQQVCFGSSCSSSSSSEITPTTPTSGFTANTLIRTDGTNFLAGPKFLSGNLSLEVGLNYCPDSGANDTYVCTLSGGSLSAYSAGTFIVLKANTANTGTATVAVDGLSAITITRRDDSALQTGDISAGDYVPLVYDGNTFRMQRGFQSGVTFDGSTLAVTGTATISGSTTIGGNDITGTTVPLTISRGSSSGNIANFQTTSGTTVSSIDNVGNFANLVAGTIAAPNFRFGSLAYGRMWYSAANAIGFTTSGSTTSAGMAMFSSALVLPSTSAFAWCDSAGDISTACVTRSALYSDATATIQMGADVNGSPVNQTFKAHDGITGTNISGAKLTIAAGRGTGNATGGTLAFQTAGVEASGTTAQTLVDRVTIPQTGGLTIVTGTKPTCDSSVRGNLFYVAGGAGVADTYEVCRKDAADAYAWVSIF